MRARTPPSQSAIESRWSLGSLAHRARYWIHRAGLGRDQLYQAAVDRLGWWPLAWISRGQRARSATPLLAAYVLARYPILSETFIRREIAALRRAGIAIQVVADEPDGPSVAADPAILESDVIYLEPVDQARRRRLAKAFIVRRPLRFLNVFLYVVFHRYASYKTLRGDTDLMLKAAYLAGVLEERGVTHVHAPWAKAEAFLCILAARLMDVSYSVHVRANDFHRTSSNFVLAEKLRNARFVVTNSRYNEAHLRPVLGTGMQGRLHVIYNGLDLEQFAPPARNGGQLKILAAGRLVEAKGFAYLLRACSMLRERGVAFQCDIIGGPQESLDANTYILLRKLHRQLELDGIVRFLGPQPFDRVIEAYASADIFALPCVIAADGSRDITPNVLLEAMAMELPVVSTPVGAIPEIVDHGVNGVLVAPNDECALADALAALAQDQGLRLRLGAAARKKVAARFDINRNVQGYAALFRALSIL